MSKTENFPSTTITFPDDEAKREMMRIKELAKKSYREDEGSQDTEGFPDGSSYIYGFMQGFIAAKKENNNE